MSNVFLAYQVPIADRRAFVTAETHRLPVPRWAGPPEGGSEFLRGLGAVRRRRRGGVAAWTGEELFCDARRAMRFPPAQGPPVLHPADDARLRLGWRFRRLYAGGVRDLRPVMRFELGLRQTSSEEELPLRGEMLREIVESSLRRHVEVHRPGEQGRRPGWQGSPIFAVGRPLSALVQRATTDHAGATAGNWLSAGTAMAIVEYAADEIDGPPRMSRAIESVTGENVTLHHCELKLGNYRPTVWFIGVGRDANRDRLRRLRLHLSRIHAEHECLKMVVSDVMEEKLAYEGPSEALRALDVYLDAALSLRFKRERNGLPQDEILSIAYRTDAIVTEGDLPTLLGNLEAARESVKKKLGAIWMGAVRP